MALTDTRYPRNVRFTFVRFTFKAASSSQHVMQELEVVVMPNERKHVVLLGADIDTGVPMIPIWPLFLDSSLHRTTFGWSQPESCAENLCIL